MAIESEIGKLLPFLFEVFLLGVDIIPSSQEAIQVILFPEKPLAEGDVIRVLEIVADCHEFDAVPPLSDIFVASTDKVSRGKRGTENRLFFGLKKETSISSSDARTLNCPTLSGEYV